ncbi:MAG: pyruvate kinase, partial [Actinomycetota bacterium]|nr:pyruvate kinase [Actinomycetota bacterium]
MPSELDRLLDDVDHLYRAILNAESRHVDQLAAVRPHHRYSAANLIHYVELRQHDVRGLQDRLSQQGLSSLGGIESHVLVSVDAVRAMLIQLTRTADVDPITTASTAPDGAALLARNAVSLLGPLPPGRVTRIMVTMPTEASSDQEMVRDMLSSGMDIARINCAHDGPEVWDAILANIRAAESQLQTSCLVSMDLGGPKLRTGPIRPGPAVRKIRPIRDPIGVVQEPAWVWLGVGPSDAIDAPALPVVPLDDAEWAGARRVGEKIRIVDARGSARTMTVERLAPGGCLVTLRKTTYLVPGTILLGRRNSGA